MYYKTKSGLWAFSSLSWLMASSFICSLGNLDHSEFPQFHDFTCAQIVPDLICHENIPLNLISSLHTRSVVSFWTVEIDFCWAFLASGSHSFHFQVVFLKHKLIISLWKVFFLKDFFFNWHREREYK